MDVSREYKKAVIERAGDIIAARMDADRMRDRIHNLDPEVYDDMVYYKIIRSEFVTNNEGSEKYAYNDAELNDKNGKKKRYDGSPITNGGKITVGVGFNMSDPGARKEWNKIFENYDKKPDFDQVYNGQKELTNAQVDHLLRSSLDKREKELEKIYVLIWDDLKLNERLAIEDSYFNAPALINPKSSFYSNIHAYYGYEIVVDKSNGKIISRKEIEKGNPEYLKNAFIELRDRSNPNNLRGLTKRRIVEAAMLNSRNAPIYSKPGEIRLPRKKISARVAETIIPRGVKNWAEKQTGSKEAVFSPISSSTSYYERS